MPTTSPEALIMTFERFPSLCQIAGTLSRLFSRQSSAMSEPSSSRSRLLSAALRACCPATPCNRQPGTNSMIATNSRERPVVACMSAQCSGTMQGADLRAADIAVNSPWAEERARLTATRTPMSTATSPASASATAVIACGFTTTASDGPICTSAAPPVPPAHQSVVCTASHGTSPILRLCMPRQCSDLRVSSCLATSFLRRCFSSRCFCSSAEMIRAWLLLSKPSNHSSTSDAARASRVESASCLAIHSLAHSTHSRPQAGPCNLAKQPLRDSDRSSENPCALACVFPSFSWSESPRSLVDTMASEADCSILSNIFRTNAVGKHLPCSHSRS
mmetsp:Transcript_47906/g.77739  ORF Transcript_47906/g.77739 Transcript_47906/m.77739 type:complete len:333 (+) Transcript_47906:531-1529(+)